MLNYNYYEAIFNHEGILGEELCASSYDGVLVRRNNKIYKATGILAEEGGFFGVRIGNYNVIKPKYKSIKDLADAIVEANL